MSDCVDKYSQQRQVCIADVNVEEGRQTEASLQQEFGKDNTLFVRCDVSKQDDLKGNWM